MFLLPTECGGSLISINVVLTAAHCIKAELKKVKLGHADLTSEDIIEVEIESIKIHPGWNNTLCKRSLYNSECLNDVALIKLSKNVDFNQNVQKINLTKNYSENDMANEDIFEKLMVAGWGRTYSGRPDSQKLSMTNQLQKLPIQYIKTEECMRMSRFYRIIRFKRLSTESLLCAKGKIPNSDSCNGDSGSPLMAFLASGEVEVIGIVSSGPKNCNGYRPALFMRISMFLPWIKDSIKEWQE